MGKGKGEVTTTGPFFNDLPYVTKTSNEKPLEYYRETLLTVVVRPHDVLGWTLTDGTTSCPSVSVLRHGSPRTWWDSTELTPVILHLPRSPTEKWKWGYLKVPRFPDEPQEVPVSSVNEPSGSVWDEYPLVDPGTLCSDQEKGTPIKIQDLRGRWKDWGSGVESEGLPNKYGHWYFTRELYISTSLWTVPYRDLRKRYY